MKRENGIAVFAVLQEQIFVKLEGFLRKQIGG
jgi:hypothetical protein